MRILHSRWVAVFFAASFLGVPQIAQAYWVYGGPYVAAGPGYTYFGPQGAALGPWDWNFNFGGGPTSVVGNSRQLTGGWNFNVGGGYNFTPRTGLVFEFMQDGLGVTDAEMAKHQAYDGDAYIYSFTLNPIWRFRIGGRVGAYLIGGGGYYQQEKRFFENGVVFVPTFHGGFLAPAQIVERDYDDTGGVNVGAGLTFNVGAGTKLFVEARYHYLFTSGTPTQIIPVTFGFRW